MSVCAVPVLLRKLINNKSLIMNGLKTCSKFCWGGMGGTESLNTEARFDKNQPGVHQRGSHFIAFFFFFQLLLKEG